LWVPECCKNVEADLCDVVILRCLHLFVYIVGLVVHNTLHEIDLSQSQKSYIALLGKYPVSNSKSVRKMTMLSELQ